MRQLIIARKDLQMSPGKLAAQCCHASLAFLVFFVDRIVAGASVGILTSLEERVKSCEWLSFSVCLEDRTL